MQRRRPSAAARCSGASPQGAALAGPPAAPLAVARSSARGSSATTAARSGCRSAALGPSAGQAPPSQLIGSRAACRRRHRRLEANQSRRPLRRAPAAYV